MAKFIEVRGHRMTDEFRFACDIEDKIILVNVDHIVTITPQDDTCIISLSGPSIDIVVNHSFSWLMGLINGQ